MEIINVVQGSQAWLDIRAVHFTASEAPAMRGVSKYQKRDELLTQKKTGITPDVSPATQALFDRGHAAEAAIRPHIEEMIEQELYPATGTKVVGGLPLLASFDGLTMMGDVVFEHKLWSEQLAEMIRSGELSEHYTIQLDQQLMLSGAEKVIFVCSDGTPDKMEWMWYSTTPEKSIALIDGWHQFEDDLENYVPVAAVIEPVAAPAAVLPVISYNLNGLAIQSNLDAYRDAAERMVEGSKLPMTTDQEFADADVRNKALRSAVKNIKDVCDRVINEVSDIAQFRDSLSGIGEMLRQAALNGEKQVKSRKEQLRFDIIREAKQALYAHCLDLENELLGVQYFEEFTADFSAAAKGKSKLSSVQSAVNDELARAKIEADGIARRIRANLKTLSNEAAGYKFLFADFRQLVHKDPEDFGALVRDRVTQHKAEEERKDEKKKIDENLGESEQTHTESHNHEASEDESEKSFRTEKERLIEWLKKLRFIDGVELNDERLIGIRSRVLTEVYIMSRDAINEVER